MFKRLIELLWWSSGGLLLAQTVTFEQGAKELTLTGNRWIRLEGTLDEKSLVGFEVFLDEKSIAYGDSLPFELLVQGEALANGPHVLAVVAQFFGRRTERFILTLHWLRPDEETRVHLVCVPVVALDGSPLCREVGFRVNGASVTPAYRWQEDVGMELVIALDISQSMELKLPALKRVIQEFIRGFAPEDRIELMAFNQHIHEIQTFAPPEEMNFHRLFQQQPEGDTNLYGALWASVHALAKSQKRRAVLLLTDGSHTVEAHRTDVPLKKSLEEGLLLAREKGVPVFPMALGKQLDREVLEEIARATGGRLFEADHRSFEAAFQSFLAQLRHQVVLAYYHQGREGAQTIEVTCPGLAPDALLYPRHLWVVAAEDARP